MDFTNKYFHLIQNLKSNYMINNNLIIQPVYLWDFQTNKKQLEIILHNSSLNTIIKQSQINNMNLEKKQRLDLITKSKLFTILAERLLTYKLK
jgi:hypothetical protein